MERVMASVPILKKALGLNNVADPTRVKHSFETGESELAVAYNVDIDSNGRVSMRKGYTATARTEASHSIFCDGGECLFIAGSALYRLNTDYSRTGVRSSMQTGARCRYVQVANRIYYTNGYQLGYVVDGVSYTWEVSTYVGPTTHRRFSNPPLGTILEVHSSRMYIVVGDVLWYSEPFAYNMYDLSSNFIQFRSEIRMIRSIKTGMFVGTDTEVIFLQGMNPREFVFINAAASVVVEGTDARIPGVRFVNGEQTDQLIMWTAQDGIYVGFPDGSARNVTRDKLIYPSANLGCAVYKDNKYLTLLQ
jgi:hypothetical protein